MPRMGRRAGGGFTWGAGSGSLSGSGTGTLRFPGVVHFTGRCDILDTAFSNVRVRVSGATTGALFASVSSHHMEGEDVSGTAITVANLAFPSAFLIGGTASATQVGS